MYTSHLYRVINTITRRTAVSLSRLGVISPHSRPVTMDRAASHVRELPSLPCDARENAEIRERCFPTQLILLYAFYGKRLIYSILNCGLYTVRDT